MMSVLSVPGLAGAQEAEAPSSFRILDIRTQGTGCNLGTVALNISSDRQAFTLSFSEFFAEITAGSGLTEAMSQCRVLFNTEQDAGWEYGVLGVNVRGAAFLDAGVRGRQVINFGALNRDGRSVLDLQGPVEQDYIHSDQASLQNVRWTGCRRNDNRQKDFAVNTRLVLNSSSPDAQGLMTVDSIDGEIKQIYDLVWRRCDGKGPRQFAFCTLSLPNPSGVERVIRTKEQGANANAALAKARAKMNERCAELGRGLDGCAAQLAQCTSSAL